jgi:hypothetical protein
VTELRPELFSTADFMIAPERLLLGAGCEAEQALVVSSPRPGPAMPLSPAIRISSSATCPAISSCRASLMRTTI